MAEQFMLPKAFTKEWYKYIWDYYKWYIIVGIFAIILAAITIVQSCTAIKYDTMINFVASVTISQEEADNLAQKCAENSDDLNNNKKVNIGFNQLNFAEENRKNIEMHSALLEKLQILYSSQDELIFIVDGYMLDYMLSLPDTADVFYKATEWYDGVADKKGDLAVSLRDSTVMKECRVNSSNLYIMIARMNYEEEMTPEEENAIKIANFLIK